METPRTLSDLGVEKRWEPWEVIEGGGDRKSNIIPETNDLHVENGWLED